MNQQTHLIGIVGGSCSGKTWLADRLLQMFGDLACRVSQDDFYKDHSHLPENRRRKINFDHPSALDWERFEKVLMDCHLGHTTSVPSYDFATHSRIIQNVKLRPRPLIIVDGLWLLIQKRIRRLFDFCVFLQCPEKIRLLRRTQRDVVERQRLKQGVQSQFKKTVAPMHHIYVEPQAKLAHLVFNEKFGENDLIRLSQPLSELLAVNSTTAEEKKYEQVLDRRITIHE